MAGNKKPSRKSGARTHIAIKVGRIKVAKQQQINGINTLIKMKNGLPLGHELNRSKIDEVMAPLEAFVTELETTGEATVDGAGKLIFWCGIESEWLPLGDSILSMCMMLDLVARHFEWDQQPTGLRDLAVKAESGLHLDQHDTAAARTAMDWIRRRVAEVTPTQWGEAYTEACAIVDARTAQQAEPVLETLVAA